MSAGSASAKSFEKDPLEIRLQDSFRNSDIWVMSVEMKHDGIEIHFNPEVFDEQLGKEAHHELINKYHVDPSFIATSEPEAAAHIRLNKVNDQIIHAVSLALCGTKMLTPGQEQTLESNLRSLAVKAFVRHSWAVYNENPSFDSNSERTKSVLGALAKAGDFSDLDSQALQDFSGAIQVVLSKKPNSNRHEVIRGFMEAYAPFADNYGKAFLPCIQPIISAFPESINQEAQKRLNAPHPEKELAADGVRSKHQPISFAGFIKMMEERKQGAVNALGYDPSRN